MKKLWSISTTVRNPERLVDFLRVLKQMEGLKFDKDAQMKYQILLIKERLYTPLNIPAEYRQLFDDASLEVTYAAAKEVFDAQGYLDPPMRGRQSVNPLNKLGFCVAKERAGAVEITGLGRRFLSPGPDISVIFLKSLLKMQFPNPISGGFSAKNGFNISPFIATLRLLQKTGGLSREEFCLFIPTLIHYRDIDVYAGEIAAFRRLKSRDEKETFALDFLRQFYGVDTLTEEQRKNPFEYGDNTMRYFRLTKYFRVIKPTLRPWKIDLEPSRAKEIEQILALSGGAAREFNSMAEYVAYLSDIDKPGLPWELNEIKAKDVALSLRGLVTDEFQTTAAAGQPDAARRGLAAEFNGFMAADLGKMDKKALEEHIAHIREFRLKLNQTRRDNLLRKNIAMLKVLVNDLKNRKAVSSLDPAEFEYKIAQCLKIVDDEISIKPNCIFDDEGNPISFAPGNRADIESYYASFNGIIEATLDVSRNQVYRESMPVMRHLRDFETRHADKPAYCIFIAPRVHDDTLNYFWYSVKMGFEGRRQKIVALELARFVEFLECFIAALEEKKDFGHGAVLALLERIVAQADASGSSVDWFNGVGANLREWAEALALQKT